MLFQDFKNLSARFGIFTFHTQQQLYNLVILRLKIFQYGQFLGICLRKTESCTPIFYCGFKNMK